MANSKISALPAASALAGTEAIPMVQGAATVAATVDQVVARVKASGAVGSTTQVLINDAGAIGADAGLTFSKATKKMVITGTGSAGSETLRVAPASGASYVRINDNGTMVIDADGSTGSTPLTIKYNGTHLASLSYLGQWLCESISIASGFLFLQKVGSNGRVSAGNVLELSTGNGGTGTKVQINNGTLGTTRDMELRDLIVTGFVKLANYTVATLPSASTSGAGVMAEVTDANATTYRSVVASGGANKVQVTSDGTNWLITG